jgi:small nuclear ribonucleoprotein (snRNP)-like protein
VRTSKLLRARLRERVIVTLKSGDAFGGVLWEADESVWVLREALAIGVGENGSNVGVDGELVLIARDIAYAQRP